MNIRKWFTSLLLIFSRLMSLRTLFFYSVTVFIIFFLFLIYLKNWIIYPVLYSRFAWLFFHFAPLNLFLSPSISCKLVIWLLCCSWIKREIGQLLPTPWTYVQFSMVSWQRENSALMDHEDIKSSHLFQTLMYLKCK